MKRFGNYLTESKNTHMEHIEDMIFNDGVDGARLAITSLQRLRNMLAGNSSKEFDITVKWDGAPAIFAGIDPSDGKFFVGTKGVFNKNPKLNKTPADVRKNHSGDLAKKLLTALKYLPDLGIKGVVQGDLLFTREDLKTDTYDDDSYTTFHPNTIVYAIPTSSQLSKQIRAARIGVVWHTIYKGNDLGSMSASFGVDIAGNLKKTRNVFSTDANYRDQSGKATFTKSETAAVTSHLSKAGSLLRTLPRDFLSLIADDDEVKMRVKAFLNQFVRDGEPFPDSGKMSNKLFDYINAFYEKEEEKYKTEKGKEGARARKAKFNKVLASPTELKALFDFFNEIVQAKLMVINKLHKAEGLRTFLRTSNGLKVTDREGYVAIDKMKGGAVKLVDRLEFSKANFSDDVLKGWQK